MDNLRPIKIVLISPKGPLYRYRGGIFKKNLRYAPLTLTTLASLVPPSIQADITIIDEGIEDVDPDIEADLIGMTVITGTAVRAYELADHFRARRIPVVLGGPHVTLVPDDAQPHADSIVEGYAEESWPELLHDFIDGKLKPRYMQNPHLKLKNLPFPRRDLLKRKAYITTHVFEATRACVHSCDFCVVPVAWGLKPYQKPVKDVVADIKQYWARKIVFIDLNLIADRHYAAELFEALIPLRVNWFGLTTTLLLKDRPLIELAARSGCTGLLIGFESINPVNLRGSKKGFNSPEEYRQVVDTLHQYGITLMACFTFGMDHDTPDVFMKTAQFAVDASIDLPRFAIVTPFPGTPLFHRLNNEGRILTQNWELYDGQHVVFQPSQMSPKALYEGHERAWKHAYSLRSTVQRFLGSRIQIPVWMIANLGYRFYANNLQRFYTCDVLL
jgi:radical SAM superfamily enzyme YgiQ (UPF0313 family)